MKSPDSGQTFHPELNLSARNVLTASLAAIAMGATSAESVHASEQQRGPVEAGLREYKALSKGDPVSYMGGKYEAFVAEQGTPVYRFSKGSEEIIKTELHDDVQVVHPVISPQSGNSTLFFHSGSTSYGLRINQKTAPFVSKLSEEGRRSPLKATDIQPKQTRISHVHSKNYLYAPGVKGNEYSTAIQFNETGPRRFVMAIGLGITASPEPRQR